MSTSRPVAFTADSARRIGDAVRTVERGMRNQPAIYFRQPGDAAAAGEILKLCKTTASWTKGATATLTLYDQGTPNAEAASSPAETLAGCVNKFADIDSGKWVMVGLFNGSWYVIAAEC